MIKTIEIAKELVEIGPNEVYNMIKEKEKEIEQEELRTRK